MSAIDELAHALVTIRRQLRRGRIDRALKAVEKAAYETEHLRVQLLLLSAELKTEKGKRREESCP